MAIFADPVLLTLIVFLVGLGVITVSRRAGLIIAVLAAVFLYSAATPLVSRYALTALEIDLENFANRPDAQPDAIVILGADIRQQSPEYGSDSVGRLSLERIRFGAHLYRETGLPILITGAAIRDSTKSIAAVMAEALFTDHRVRARWLEERARNTFENAEYAAALLRAENIDAVYLVTHSWHMRRAIEAFQEVGVIAIPRATGSMGAAPPFRISAFVPNSAALQNSAFALHEWFGRYWYRIRYY